MIFRFAVYIRATFPQNSWILDLLILFWLSVIDPKVQVHIQVSTRGEAVSKNGTDHSQGMLIIKKQQWKLKLETAKTNYYMTKFRNSLSCKQLFGKCDEQSSLPSIYEDSALPNMFAVYFLEKSKTSETTYMVWTFVKITMNLKDQSFLILILCLKNMFNLLF